MALTIAYQGELAEQAIREIYPEAEPRSFHTLRHAVHRVADQSVDLALIPLEQAAGGTVWESYDLLLEYRLMLVAEVARHEILTERMQSFQDAVTRLVLVSRRGPRRPKPPRLRRPRLGWKTSLAIAVRNEPGALATVLAPFGHHGLTLSKLETRPRRDPPWEQLVFIDVDGRRSDREVAGAIRELRPGTTFFQVLGTYQRALAVIPAPRRRRRAARRS
jgi:prephenate dehydratase